MLSDRCPVYLSCSVCDIGALWPNGWTIKMKLGMQVGLGPGHIVRWGPPKGAPIFGLYLLWPNAGWIKMKLGMQVDLGHGHIVLDGDPAPPPPKRGRAPHFRPMPIVAKQLDGSKCHLVQR